MTNDFSSAVRKMRFFCQTEKTENNLFGSNFWENQERDRKIRQQSLETNELSNKGDTELATLE